MAVSLQAQILALRTAVEAALTGASADERGPEVPWSPGQRLTAQVEAELPGGRYQIRVGTFQFDVELPVKAQVGDALRLEFLSASPRVAFGLTPDAQEPVAPGTAADRSPQVQISAAGRVLTQAVLAGMTTSRGAAAQDPVRDSSPLLPAPPGPAAPPPQIAALPLAAALKAALDRSGLFYESHLVQWFAGERPLAALLREPQGRLSSLAQQQNSAENADSVQPRADPAVPRAQSVPISQPTVPRAPAEETRTTPAPVDPQVLGQVRSQLDVIEQRQILWQGQAWPGQALEWRVEDPPPHAVSQDEPTPWTTHLRLSLPRLGEVSAEINLSAGHVRVRLTAQAEAPAGTLRAAQNQLNEALTQAGLVLTGFVVTSDDAA